MTLRMVNKIFKHSDVFPHEVGIAPSVYIPRQTVKGIVLNEHNMLVLVSKKGSGFYFLPGGGVEDGENSEEALLREVQEEVGCDIKIIQKFATTEEYRDRSAELYKTDCFVARVLTDEEGSNYVPTDSLFGLDNVWLNRAEASELLNKQYRNVKPDMENYYNRGFNSARDLFLVKTSMDINLSSLT